MEYKVGVRAEACLGERQTNKHHWVRYDGAGGRPAAAVTQVGLHGTNYLARFASSHSNWNFKASRTILSKTKKKCRNHLPGVSSVNVGSLPEV